MTRSIRTVSFVVVGLALALSLSHFVLSAQRTRANGFVDFPIFARQAAEFLDSGELYPRVDDLDYYRPAAPVYKFPPLYAMLILPFVKHGVSPSIYFNHWVLQLLLYLAAVPLLLHAGRRPPSPVFVAGVLLLALNLEPFFETLWGLQVETPILALLALCLWLTGRGRYGPAGAALGVCVMLKIYPAFLLVYFLIKRRWPAVFWCLATMALILVSTLIVVGADENAYYFLTIFPYLLDEAPELTSENVGLARYALAVGAGPGLAKRAAQALCLAGVAVSVLAVWRRRDRTTDLDEPLQLVLFVPLMLLALPNSWVNYQVLLLLPLSVVLGWLLSRRDVALPAALVAVAFGLLLFYRPCGDPALGWPCTVTPHLLGLVQLPRALHDAVVDWRGLSSVLLWVVTLAIVWRDTGDE